ncbi:hypothetical protein V3C99_017283 [Haemonchus contortus]|uniref:Chitin-binding type-2 domain-containing protein n=1 Tax=Haemonchus contortus TaxID=6289 RepID=A0A7I4Z4X2_HAECO|nr:unnamed protein product [Haemonchus contortus]
MFRTILLATAFTVYTQYDGAAQASPTAYGVQQSPPVNYRPPVPQAPPPQVNYGPPAPAPQPRPVQYGPALPPMPRPQYYPLPPPLVLKPIILPELPAPQEFLYSDPYYPSYNGPSECEPQSSGDSCQNCPRIQSGCYGTTGTCFRPQISMVRNRKCMAIVSCGVGNYTLETAQMAELSSGMGINKLIRCNGWDWQAEDINGAIVDAGSLRCVAPVAPVTPVAPAA